MVQTRNNILLKKIAVRLKTLREEKGLTQEEMYNETNIHIARIETAKVNISVSTLSSLCKFFNVSLVEFFKKIDK